MRSSAAYMMDILENIESLDRFLSGRNIHEFLQDDLLRSAVHSKLVIIGEAVSSLPDALTEKYSTIPWNEITRFRNLIIHGYFKVDWDIMWGTATQRVHELREVIEQMMHNEFPDYRPENE
jgi:uncharacterized protein with HEPN domain